MRDEEYAAEDNALSKQDAILLLDVIHKSLFCRSEEDFRALIADMQQLLPFDSAACLMGKKSGREVVTQYDLINISYPDEWLLNYVTKNYHLIDPIVHENFRTFSLQYWQDTYKKYAAPERFVKEAEDFKLRRGYSIGQRNLMGTEGSLFSFAGESIENNERTTIILRRLTPHLHQAFIRLRAGEGAESRPVRLTKREKEILLWIKDGKSTWEVSAILALSQDTIKFHLKNIYRKLNTTSRSHAVAIALGAEMLDL